jgi:hypothetical protein
MRTSRTLWVTLIALLLGTLAPLAVLAQSEVPAGTRFLVELRDMLEPNKIKVGKKFEGRTLEALQATDGGYIEAGAKLKGRVSYVDGNRVQLRFEKIDTRRGWVPIVATVTGTVGERNLKVGDEGEVKASTGRGKSAAIGAAIGAGVGAAVGASQGGGKGAAIGAGVGAATGAIVGATAGGREPVIHEGARLELTLDRPLVFRPRR